jgi:hypothetical protein
MCKQRADDGKRSGEEEEDHITLHIYTCMYICSFLFSCVCFIYNFISSFILLISEVYKFEPKMFRKNLLSEDCNINFNFTHSEKVWSRLYIYNP